MLNVDGTLPTWRLIQRRGQYGNPEDFFSSKLWTDYEQGFGELDKGRMLVLFSINHFATEFWLGLKTLADLGASRDLRGLPGDVLCCHLPQLQSVASTAVQTDRLRVRCFRLQPY